MTMAVAVAAQDEHDMDQQRERMVERQIERRGIENPRVLQALREVKRHLFVPPDEVSEAYEDHPLPIGHGQTISQPYIVALMTESIDPRASDRVLEIGTGSGYQAAVLSKVVKSVYSIEIVEALGRDAAQRLASLGYRNVEVRIGDGYKGWPEKGPVDGIIVTAAAPFVPTPLIEQLKPGAKMVIPVDAGILHQNLLLVEKQADGTTKSRVVLRVRFVPLTGPGVREGVPGRK